MPQHNILDVLSQYGEVELEQYEYLRIKRNNKGFFKKKNENCKKKKNLEMPILRAFLALSMSVDNQMTILF